MPGIDEIVWVDFLIPEPRIISKNEVKDWEERFGYTLSEDFREVARKNQARRPKLEDKTAHDETCLLYTSPSPRDLSTSRMPSSA